jgi:predicted Zn finger-like uncharacterized protein
MALATQCPHCNTTFRVAADQLKLRGGIVRCGACHEVFDGNASLVDLDKIVPDAPPPVPPSPSAEFDAQVAEIEAREAAGAEPIYTLDFDNTFDPFGILPKIEGPPAPPPEPEPVEEVDHSMQVELPLHHVEEHEAPVRKLDIDFTLDLDPVTVPHPWPEEVPAPEPVPDALSEAEAEPEPEPEAEAEPQAEAEAEEMLAEAAEAGSEPVTKVIRRRGGRPRPPKPAPAFAETELLVDHELDLNYAEAPETEAAEAEAVEALPEALPEAEHDEPEFVKKARREERLGRVRRNLMIAGSVVLALGLAVQGLTTFRNVLAARFPQLNPMLVQACASLGCRIELPTQLDTLVIEQGELRTLGDDTFSLVTQVRNQGALAQAWPHIELTLTDANDKALLRRVLAPADYLPPALDKSRGFAARGEQPVKLYFTLNQIKASGYTVAVFYP